LLFFLYSDSSFMRYKVLFLFPDLYSYIYEVYKMFFRLNFTKKRKI